MFAIIFPFLIILLFLWIRWIWKKCYKAFPFCIIFIIEISWGLLSIGWIDSGTYISEQYRNSYFIGALFDYLLLMAPFAYIFPKYLQKLLIKNQHRDVRFFKKINWGNVIWWGSVIVVIYLFVDLVISGIPLINPQLSKVGYYTKWSILPFAGKFHAILLPFIILLCGIKLAKSKRKSKTFIRALGLTISIFLLQILLDYKFFGLYDYLIWLFIPIISFYWNRPLHNTQRKFVNRPLRNTQRKFVNIGIVGGVIFLIICYLKYSRIYTDPFNILLSRIFSLQSHTFWGVDLLVKQGEMGFNIHTLLEEISAGFAGVPLVTSDYGVGRIMYAVTRETTANDLISTGILFSSNFITVALSYSGYLLTFIYSGCFGLVSAYLTSIFGYYLNKKKYVMLFLSFFIYLRIYEYFRVGALSIILSWKFILLVIVVVGIQLCKKQLTK